METTILKFYNFPYLSIVASAVVGAAAAEAEVPKVRLAEGGAGHWLRLLFTVLVTLVTHGPSQCYEVISNGPSQCYEVITHGPSHCYEVITYGPSQCYEVITMGLAIFMKLLHPGLAIVMNLSHTGLAILL